MCCMLQVQHLYVLHAAGSTSVCVACCRFNICMCCMLQVQHLYVLHAAGSTSVCVACCRFNICMCCMLQVQPTNSAGGYCRRHHTRLQWRFLETQTSVRSFISLSFSSFIITIPPLLLPATCSYHTYVIVQCQQRVIESYLLALCSKSVHTLELPLIQGKTAKTKNRLTENNCLT